MTAPGAQAWSFSATYISFRESEISVSISVIPESMTVYITGTKYFRIGYNYITVVAMGFAMSGLQKKEGYSAIVFFILLGRGFHVF